MRKQYYSKEIFGEQNKKSYFKYIYSGNSRITKIKKSKFSDKGKIDLHSDTSGYVQKNNGRKREYIIYHQMIKYSSGQ